MSLNHLQLAIFRRRLISTVTLELSWCDDFMYENFFSVWTAKGE